MSYAPVNSQDREAVCEIYRVVSSVHTCWTTLQEIIPIKDGGTKLRWVNVFPYPAISLNGF